MKLAVVSGIRQCVFLPTPEVKQQLQRLMAMKSIAKNAHSLAQFREAVRAIDGRARP